MSTWCCCWIALVLAICRWCHERGQSRGRADRTEPFDEVFEAEMDDPTKDNWNADGVGPAVARLDHGATAR